MRRPNLSRRWSALALLALLALAVAASLAPSSSPPARASTSPLAGDVDLARLDEYVSDQVRRHGIPGLALGVVSGTRVVDVRGFGAADDTGRPVTPQTPFLLASVSKPLTATAILQLVEAGRVELDAPAQRYVPDFRLADPTASARITIRQLLQHTSGIPVTSCDTRHDARTLAEYVAELRTVRPAAAPGARHSYCSGNYNVLGRVVETVSGQSYGQYMQQHVFAPLAMRNTFSDEAAARRAGLAQGHRWLFGRAVSAHERYNTSQLPSGFLISSAEDMTHFLVAQLDGGRYGDARVLRASSVSAMHAPGVPIGQGQGTYGLGWKLAPVGDVPVIQHAGDNVYYHGIVFFDPATRRGAVLLSNSNGLLVTSAYREIEAGGARVLGGGTPGPPSTSLGRLYAIVDTVLALLLALAVWPLVRLPRWSRALRTRIREGRTVRWRWRLLRAGCEIVLPAALLAATRLVLHLAGAQSWTEGLGLLPETGGWLWVVCL